jgi:hypothetical protein
MNVLLIYMFSSMKLEKGHEKYYLALVLKLCYHYDILRNRLKYYTERLIKWKSKYYLVEKNVFSRIFLFRANIYNVNWTSAQSFSCKFIINTNQIMYFFLGLPVACIPW